MEKIEESKTEEKVVDDAIYNDGTGPLKFTNKAILKPIPFPE